jgi:hypothetical protein
MTMRQNLGHAGWRNRYRSGVLYVIQDAMERTLPHKIFLFYCNWRSEDAAYFIASTPSAYGVQPSRKSIAMN